MRLLQKLTLLMAGLYFILGPAYGADYELRASSNLAATGTVGKALQKFVDLINEKTQGRRNKNPPLRRAARSFG